VNLLDYIYNLPPRACGQPLPYLRAIGSCPKAEKKGLSESLNAFIA